MQISQCVLDGQKKTTGIWWLSSTAWVLGIQRRCSVLAVSGFTLNHFTGFEIHRKTCRLYKWGIQFEKIGSNPYGQVVNNIYRVSQAGLTDVSSPV